VFWPSPAPSRSAVAAATTRGPRRKFVVLAERIFAAVEVVKDDEAVAARSIMGLMMLGTGKGSTIDLRAEGVGREGSADALAALIEAGFNETD
jgi:phosphocarrier protein HPr